MIKKNEELLTGFIPVTFKMKTQQDNANRLKIIYTPTLVSKDGQTIEFNKVPTAWVKYMCECVNNFDKLQEELKMCGYRLKKSTVIASIKIPGRVMPISESNIITKSKDNQYMIEYSSEYRKWLKEVKASEWSMRSALSGENLPIDFEIRIEFLFYVKRSRKQPVLSEFIDSALEVLSKLGIIKNKSHRVVTSFDGSKVIYSKKSEHTIAIIHTSTEG